MESDPDILNSSDPALIIESTGSQRANRINPNEIAEPIIKVAVRFFLDRNKPNETNAGKKIQMIGELIRIPSDFPVQSGKFQ